MIPGVVAADTAFSTAPGIPWTPLNMATVPQIYLDAQDSVVTDVGGVCSAISNLGAMGSAGNFSQATSSNRPSILAAELNGRRVLRFDGSTDCVTCGSSAGRAVFSDVAAAWVFSVHKKRGLDGAPTFRIFFYSLDGADTGYRFLLLAGNNSTGRANKPSLYAKRLDGDAPVFLDSPNVVQGVYSMTVSAVNYATRAAMLRENGAQVIENLAYVSAAGNTFNTSPAAPISIGAFHTGVFGADVDLAAILIGNVYPSAGEFEKLEGWAAHKWGLTANLPSGHPYKTTAPTI